MRCLLICCCFFLLHCSRPVEAPPNTQAINHASTMDSIQAQLDKGDIERAQTALTKAFNDGYEHPMAFYLQGRIYLAQSNKNSAANSIPWFEKAIAASPAWIEPRLLLAQACIADKRLRRAEQLFEELNALLPEGATGPYGLGLIDMIDGKDDQAVIHFDEALKRNPNYGPALMNRASIAGKRGDHTYQRELLERYIALDPVNSQAHFAIGVLFHKLNRLNDATRSFKRSYELNPDTETARRLADLAIQKQDEEEQKYWLERAK